MINNLKQIVRQITQKLLLLLNAIKEKTKTVALKRDEQKTDGSLLKRQKKDGNLKMEQELIRLLQKESQGLTMHEIVYSIGVKKSELHKTVDKLIKGKKVKRNKGLYFKN